MYLLENGTMLISESDSTVVCAITINDITARLKLTNLDNGEVYE